MITGDTSVLVAAFCTWHERHDEASSLLEPGVPLIAHCAVECFSVLTRLPPPHRISPASAAEWLSHRFPKRWMVLSGEGYSALVARARSLGIAGGAIYDGIVAATAKEAGLALGSFDVRASTTYRALGVSNGDVS